MIEAENFDAIVRTVIDDRHGVLVALSLYDRGPSVAGEWERLHSSLEPHKAETCPMWAGGEATVSA